MIMLICVLYAFLVVATFFIAFTRRSAPEAGEELRIREHWMTILLGAALWAEAGVLLFYAVTQPEAVFHSQNTVINTCIFLALSAVLGSGMILYGTVKCILVTKEHIVSVNLLGQRTTIAWNQISAVQQTAGKRMTLQDKNGEKISVGGNRAIFRSFVALASQRVPAVVAGDTIANLKTALK